jgi:hypothetical protein
VSRLSKLGERFHSVGTLLASSFRKGAWGILARGRGSLAKLLSERRIIRIFPGRRCATASETKRLLDSLVKQSPYPHVHCFIGKQNVFDCEVIFELLEQTELCFSFSPANGPRLNQDEIYHLVAFWKSPPTITRLLRFGAHSTTNGKEICLAAAGAPARLGCPTPKLSGQKGPPVPSDVRKASLLATLSPSFGQANFDPNRMAVPSWTTRERLLSGGWFGIAIPPIDEEEEKALIARAFAIARSAVASGEPRPARLLIAGWYGTETLGDKAILGGVIIAARKKFPRLRSMWHRWNPM